MKRYGQLTEQIISPENLNESFDEVIGNLHKARKEVYEVRKDKILQRLVNEISTGTFNITEYYEFQVKDGGKIRTVQSPSVEKRIGCNAIMRVVEQYVYRSIIPTSASSIKGRGMHKLSCKIRSDIRKNPQATKYYYKCDIKKYYESIPQDKMWKTVQKHIKDKTLLPILKNFVTMMPKGLSIGLRSSQCFGNLYLSSIDHFFKESLHVRHYYRYCDDIVILAQDKRTLWQLRSELHDKITELGLSIKPNECIRPLSVGLDFLGYVFDGQNTRLRKRIKTSAAKKLIRIKSKTRRQKVMGSFKGVAKWANCKHLYYVLTGKRMDFKDIIKNKKLQYIAEDGKKRFTGKQTSLHQLINVHIRIEDFETDVNTKNGKRTVVSFSYDNGEKGKYFTADKQQLWYLNKIKEADAFPFNTTIGNEIFTNGKVRYIFT